MYGSHRKVLKRVMNRMFNDKSISIIDIGCGKGSTLTSLRSWGFCNSIGIDLSDSGLVECEKSSFTIGKDVFKIDATNTSYSNREFYVVFSEGLLEHYADFSPFVKEMSRIADKYVILIQPNHFSFYSKIIQFGWHLFRKNSGGVEELTHHLYEYIGAFMMTGFKLLSIDYTLLKENTVMVFKRVV